MEQIINKENLDELFEEAKFDSSSYQQLVELLYLDCIKFQIQSEDENKQIITLVDNLNDYSSIERISLYLLSNYSRTISNSYPPGLIQKAMNVAAIAFEKLAFFISTIIDEQINESNIILKQLRYYFRSSVAYTLAENAPNSSVIALKMHGLIRGIDLENIKNIDYFEIMIVCSNFLSRKFSLEFNNIKNEKLQIISREFYFLFRTGNSAKYLTCLTIINELKDEYRKNGSSFRYYCTDMLEQVFKKIWQNSIWQLMADKFDYKYLKALIQSNPPIYEIWPNQKKIISNDNSIINNDEIKRSVINFNTSGGKSLIAELSIVKELSRRPEKKCFYIVPTNALVHEVTKRFQQRFRRLNIIVNDMIGGFDTDIDIDEANIVVTTPEKLLTIIRTNYDSKTLDLISLIIFDEFHKISEYNRGWIIESSIWYLISHSSYKKIKLLFLSAIIDNGEVVLNWLDDDNNYSDHLYSDSWKPSQTLKAVARETFHYSNIIKQDDELYEKWNDDKYILYYANCILDYNKKFKNQNYNIPLFIYPKYRERTPNRKGTRPFKDIPKRTFATGVAQQLSKIGTTLILLNTKDQCEKFISEYEPYFTIEKYNDIRIDYLINYVRKRYDNEHLLISGLAERVIFHYGSLPDDVREALEDAINLGLINIVVSTTTLLEGVNFPIQNFIYYGKEHGNDRTISISDLKNIAGRAGRAHKHTYGQIIFINNKSYYFEEDKLDYEKSKSELISSLANDSNFFDSIDNVLALEEHERDELLHDLSILPFFQSLLIFYTSDILNDESVSDILDKSFFSKSLLPEKMNDFISFSKSVIKYFNTFERSTLLLIQKSGLSIASFRKINSIAQDIINSIAIDNEIINDFTNLISKEHFNRVIEIKEFSPKNIKKSTGNSSAVIIEHYEMLIDWFINKKSITSLTSNYFTAVNNNYRMNRITEYIKDVYEFKLPWAFNILFSIIADNLALDIFKIDRLKDYSRFIKYGLSDLLELKLIDYGISSRETIIELAKLLYNKDVGIFSKEEIFESLVQFSEHDYIGFTEYEIRKINQATNQFRKTTNILEEEVYISFNIAGTKYYLCVLENRKDLISDITSDTINFEREHKNYYDENAIIIKFHDIQIGFVPRNLNEEIAYYLDLGYNFQIELLEKEIIDINKYIKITLRICLNDEFKQ